MGSVLSIFKPKPKKPRLAPKAPTKSKVTSGAEAEDKQKRAALKLALISSGAGGVFSTAKTTKKKLLGN